MQIASHAFVNNGKIPNKYTCDGEDVNPPLEFFDVPEEAQSLALIVEDPDSPGKTWMHWIIFNIKGSTTGIPEDTVPNGAIEAVTDFGNTGYGGPCPTTGTHRYRFKLYALNTFLDLSEDTTRDELIAAMDGHVIDEAELTGLYTRE